MERLNITLTVEVQVEVPVKEGAMINLLELKQIKEDALMKAVEMMTTRPFVEGTDVRLWLKHSDLKLEPSEVPFLGEEDEEEEEQE